MRGRDSWVGVSSPGPSICSKERPRDTRRVDTGPEGPTQSLTLSQKGLTQRQRSNPEQEFEFCRGAGISEPGGLETALEGRRFPVGLTQGLRKSNIEIAEDSRFSCQNNRNCRELPELLGTAENSWNCWNYLEKPELLELSGIARIVGTAGIVGNC